MKNISLLILLFIVYSTANATTLLEAVGDSNTSFIGVNAEVLKKDAVDIQIYNLNGPEELNKILSDKLPPDKSKAIQIVRKRLPLLEAKAKQAYQGITAAIRYRLTGYPAIVINRKYIIYGETNLASAYVLYQQWLKNNE